MTTKTTKLNNLKINMEIIINSDKDLRDYFSEEIILAFADTCYKNISKLENPKPAIAGMWCIDNVPTIDDDKLSVACEFNAKILDNRFVDMGFTRFILYTGIMPDSVLDMYNDLKKAMEKIN